MFGQPFYNKPYQSAYAQAQRAYPPTDPGWLRALADQRRRRRQWLPDEDADSEEEWEYNQLRPQERLYLDARKRKDTLERKEREERLASERALQELAREQAARKDQVLEERIGQGEGSTHSQLVSLVHDILALLTDVLFNALSSPMFTLPHAQLPHPRHLEQSTQNVTMRLHHGYSINTAFIDPSCPFTVSNHNFKLSRIASFFPP